jgi:hypothetical protein
MSQRITEYTTQNLLNMNRDDVFGKQIGLPYLQTAPTTAQHQTGTVVGAAVAADVNILNVSSFPVISGFATEITLAAIRSTDGIKKITDAVTVNTHAVTVASGGIASGAAVDGAIVTLGAKADAKDAHTDNTAITVMQVLKEISYMEQTPASRAVTNAGTFSVQDSTGAINVGSSVLSPIFAAISATTYIGDNTLVAASAGYQIRVLSMYLSSDAAVSIRFESAAGGTALSGVIPLVANQGFVLPYNKVGWFQTDTTHDDLLNLELTGTGNVYGFMTYILVPD